MTPCMFSSLVSTSPNLQVRVVATRYRKTLDPDRVLTLEPPR